MGARWDLRARIWVIHEIIIGYAGMKPKFGFEPKVEERGAPFPRSELGPCRTSTAGAGMQVMRRLPEKKRKKEIKKNPRCICLAACANLGSA